MTVSDNQFQAQAKRWATKIRKFADRFAAGGYDIRARYRSQISLAKLATLDRTGRPVFAASPEMRRALVRFMKAEIEKALKSRLEYMPDFETALAAAAKGVVKLRLSHSGNDVHFKALSPEYAQWKALEGLDPRIGVARGVLLRETDRAVFTVYRKR